MPNTYPTILGGFRNTILDDMGRTAPNGDDVALPRPRNPIPLTGPVVGGVQLPDPKVPVVGGVVRPTPKPVVAPVVGGVVRPTPKPVVAPVVGGVVRPTPKPLDRPAPTPIPGNTGIVPPGMPPRSDVVVPPVQTGGPQPPVVQPTAPPVPAAPAAVTLGPGYKGPKVDPVTGKQLTEYGWDYDSEALRMNYYANLDFQNYLNSGGTGSYTSTPAPTPDEWARMTDAQKNATGGLNQRPGGIDQANVYMPGSPLGAPTTVAAAAPAGNTGIVPAAQGGSPVPTNVQALGSGPTVTASAVAPQPGTGGGAPVVNAKDPKTGADSIEKMWNDLGGGNDPTKAWLSGLNNRDTIVTNSMNTILDQNGKYISNARRRGAEGANARGMLNSSIGAGAGERAAIEAAQPLFDASMQLVRQREAEGFQGMQANQDRMMTRLGLSTNLLNSREDRSTRVSEASKDRIFQAKQANLDRNFQGSQAQKDRELRTKLQSDATFQQDWLADRNFSREFNSALSMVPINSSLQFQALLQQYALDNPEVYTPNVISGMSDFFDRNMQDILSKYFSAATNTTNATGRP